MPLPCKDQLRDLVTAGVDLVKKLGKDAQMAGALATAVQECTAASQAKSACKVSIFNDCKAEDRAYDQALKNLETLTDAWLKAARQSRDAQTLFNTKLAAYIKCMDEAEQPKPEPKPEPKPPKPAFG